MKESERKLLLGIMCLVLVVMGGTYALRTIHEGISPRTTIRGYKGESNVTVEERSYFFHGKKVYGKIYLPDDTTERHPLLVYCHGLGQTGDESKNICTNAARIGYVAYSLDFRGGGRDSRSDGDVYRMSARTEVKDLGHVLGRLMKEDFVDKDRVYLCGHSLGALVASLYACKEPKEIAGAILIAPAYNLPDMAKEKYPDPDDIERKTELLSYPVGDVFFQDIYDMNPYRKARKYKGPVLLIHGVEDDIVPISYSEKAMDEFPNARLIEMPGVKHVFHGADGNKLRSYIDSYLRDELSEERTLEFAN